MNKKQKEVELAKLQAEEKELKYLKAIYNKAADDIANKLEISNGKINVLLKEFDNLDDVQKSILQSQIYQRNFQLSLKKQIDGFLSVLQTDQYTSIDEYLKNCYETGFIGTMYDLHGQGIPLVLPIDQKQAAAAIKLDPKISKNLYTKLGEDVSFLKKRIANNVSRGIATASEYKVIARNIAADSNVGFNRAMRIARTEGHGVQVQAAVDVQYKAKEKGADIVKQWDAALDGRTRKSHRQVDGEIRELDEPFSNGMMYPSDPAGGASEVVNCRCALLQRAKWALDEEFTKMNNFTKEIETFKSPASYAEFKKGFFSAGNIRYMNYVEKMQEKYKTKDFRKVLDSMTEREYKHYSKLLADNPVFNVKPNKDVDIDSIKNKITKNNKRIEELSKQVNDVHAELEKEMMFGSDLAKVEALRKKYDSLKNEVENLTKENNKLKGMLPKVDASKSDVVVVNGKNLIGDVDYKNSEFDFDIETAINAQGYDGKPNVVSYEEFKKAMQESNFYAERTYSASSQELLDEYRNQLYNGKWYIDCSEGGAQYGQGMYCAAVHDLSERTHIGGIGMEMSHYQQIGLSKGNGFYYTEAITLKPNSKIFTMVNDTTDIVNRYAKEYALKNAKSDKAKELIQEVIDIQERIDYYSCSHLCGKVDWDKVDSLYEKRNKIYESEVWKNEVKPLVRDGLENAKGINEGALAAEMGYDAINAIGHGESGSYTVILNRTKVIFCEGGSIYGN